MKNLTLITIFGLFFASCGEENKSSENTSSSEKQKDEVTDSTAHNDSTLIANDNLADNQEDVELIHFSDEFKTKLTKYFSEKDVESLQSWVLAGQQIKLDSDFINWYLKGHELIDSYSATLQNITDKHDAYDVVDDLGWKQPEFQGLNLACVAECTELEFTFNNIILDSISKLSDGSKDDELMKLCRMSEGDYGDLTEYGFKNWFSMTWDYGGSTLIGDSSAYNFLVSYDRFVQEHGESDLTELLGNVRRNALEMAYDYSSHMYSPSKITTELRMILEEVKLSKGEKERIEDRIEQLKDPKANSLDVNCETENCPYG